MVLDTAPPHDPDTSADADVGRATLGPFHTTRQQVELTGTTEPGARVELYRGSQGSAGTDPRVATLTADASGHYTFHAVDLNLNNQRVWDNPLTVESRDTAGNLSRSLVTFTTHDLDKPTLTVSLRAGYGRQ